MKDTSIFEGWKEFSFKNKSFRAEELGNNMYSLYELHDNYVYMGKIYAESDTALMVQATDMAEYFEYIDYFDDDL